ncbi:FtsX-like permease family protein [Spirosoma endbachense]|uniref:FtsX-like permease family protein n=2 Tax=Spirosoma endbachense TaxID=2666025 RepID=A0A6P1WB44_9BACT|nr:FtsX-like permease family protein [Spirosoma endbachense]
MLRNYVLIAVRTLKKHQLYSILNIGGLALGMACCLLISLYIYDELSYDRFNANYRRIYRVIEKQKQAEGIFDVAVTPGPLASSLLKDFPEVEKTTRIGRWSGVLTQRKQAVEPEQMLIVDPSFFSLFNFSLIAGNQATVFRGPNEVIFSEAMAERFFGKDWSGKNIVGQSVQLNTQQNLLIVGVARNPPTRSHIQFDVLLPFKWLEKNDEWSMKWNSNSYHTYLLLRPELAESGNSDRFADKIRSQLKRYDGGNETQLLLQPMSDIYLYSKFSFETDWGKRSDIAYVRIFIAVGLIVLLIAIINFINLATARASGRAKEVGMRKTLGAQRLSLVGQFLCEALLMTGLAVFMALLMAEVLLPLFNDVAGTGLQIPYHLPLFWLTLAVLTGVVSLLTGLYPAFFLSSFRPAVVLKGLFNSQKGLGFRQSLVVGQFTLSIIMIIGTVIIYKQLAYMQTAKLGFDKSQLLYVRLKGDLRSKAWQFKDQVAQLPGVARSSVTTSNLVGIMNSTVVEWEGQTPKDEFLMTNMNVDQDFISTTGMSIAAGRNFSAKIPSDTSSKLQAYLINETAAKRMGWSSATALGKRIKHWGQEGQVIGVLKDFHFRPLRVAIEPFIFRFQPSNPYFNLLVKTEPGTLSRTQADIAAVYKKLDPANPLSYGFVDQDLEAQYRAEQRVGRIILYFSILTILIACLGLFGLATFTAEQRTKEIGIRKVLGASVASITSLLSKDFLRLVLIAILIAIPISWYAVDQWLKNFAYKTAIEWWVFALSGLLTVAVALLTVSFQSIKAALMNPVKTLRSE